MLLSIKFRVLSTIANLLSISATIKFCSDNGGSGISSCFNSETLAIFFIAVPIVFQVLNFEIY